MASKSKVGIDELNAAIQNLTTGTGQFAGMMEKQSQTFQGMLSTLNDEIAQFGRQAGEESRIKDLSSILKAHETIERLKPIHDKYVKINWKAVKAKYAEQHKAELDEYNKAFRLLKKFNIDLNFHFDAYEGERKTLVSRRDKLQEELEQMKSDLKPLEDVRYYIGKVIPLDDVPVQTEPERKSVLEQICTAKKEQSEKQAVQTELPSKKKRRNDLE